MAVTLPGGVVPVRALSTGDILSGSRTTSYRWEVFTHASGVDSLAGNLDGVIETTASLSWSATQAVKGSGMLKVSDLAAAQAGMLRIGALNLTSVRLRPVLSIEGLPDIYWGMFLVSTAPEEWSDAGRVFSIGLLDKATVLDQDLVDQTYTVDTATPILSAVATVIASAGESIAVDAAVTSTLAAPMVWLAGTSKLQIVNDLLRALNYNSLWVDGLGNFRATPYVVPAKRSIQYELLAGLTRELVDGPTSIYSPDWTRDRDNYKVPNKVIAVQAATGAAAALSNSATNTDPSSPYSYAARGNRWISVTVPNVECPAGDNTATLAFLAAKAKQSLIAASAVQAAVKVKHLPIPLRPLEVLTFENAAAGIERRHVAMQIKLEANPLGLMETTLQEVVDL